MLLVYSPHLEKQSFWGQYQEYNTDDIPNFTRKTTAKTKFFLHFFVVVVVLVFLVFRAVLAAYGGS